MGDNNFRHFEVGDLVFLLCVSFENMETQMMMVEDVHNRRDYIYNDFYPIENCKVKLTNKELWDQFHELQTEMIITKTGRRMFPALKVQLSNLDPNADYCVFLEMTLVHHCRFKYSSSGGWSPAGHEEAQSPHRLYLHPESPSKGAHWMSQDLSFSRVKLTNTCSPPQGQMVLSSMHKYQPRILIVKSHNSQALRWAPTKAVVFPETQFVAVTAYQNEKITKLKINYNPFAKGFRENGKSNSKRKHVCEEEESSGRKKAVTPSPPPPPAMDDVKKSGTPVVPIYYYPSYPVYGQWWNAPVPFYYPCPKKDCGLVYPQENKPKKITDFSINAIMKL